MTPLEIALTAACIYLLIMWAIEDHHRARAEDASREAAFTQADTDVAYIDCAKRLLRSEQENAELRRLVENEPVAFVPADIAARMDGIRGRILVNEAERFLRDGDSA